jgi:capsular polysaccharide export protein
MVFRTSGISSMDHNTAVHIMGEAIYKMPGLTHQGSLQEFWTEPSHIDRKLYRGLRK